MKKSTHTVFDRMRALFLEVCQLRIILILTVLRMAHMAHGAIRTAATAGGFSPFFVASYFHDDREAKEKQTKCDEDG